MEVTVYTTTTCPWCRATKEYLGQHKIPFREVNVETDPKGAFEMTRISGQQGVPVTTIDGEVIVGFDKARLDQAIRAGDESPQPSRPSQQAKQAPQAPQPPPPSRPKFGAAVADASRHLTKLGQIPIFGAFVGKVAQGSPAHAAGLQPGDVITQIHVRPVNNAADVEAALEATSPGDIVDVRFVRGSQDMTTKALL